MLWRDWNWVEDRLTRIYRDRRDQRRFDLQAYLTSAAYAFGGEEQGEGWRHLFDATMTAKEREQAREAQEAQEMAQLAEDRAARLAAMGGGGGLAAHA